MIGTSIHQYEILEQLGSGGMGVVYKARDTKLDRFVALKFLPPELSRDPDTNARFMQEARAASALDHPNICTIHDIGTTEDGRLFIVMAFYTGQTLKYRLEEGPLDTDRAVDIAGQIIEGLGAAHRGGIIHRDIKPANIMVTDQGRVKILDFGVAKLTGGLDMTKTGSTLGTVYYMAPEQIRGQHVGPSTDVWSFGVVLYQMLAGARPFTGEYEQAVVYAALNEAPRALEAYGRQIPVALSELVFACLSKEPRSRPDTTDVARRLEESTTRLTDTAPAGRGVPGQRIMTSAWVVVALLVVLMAVWLIIERSESGSASDLRSIAVLPMKSQAIGGTDEAAFLADGIHDDILTQLAKIGDLKVISRTSVMQYRDTDKSSRDIGAELDVATILEGSVQSASGRIRVNVQLIEAATDRHLWAETYDEELNVENIFAIQGALAKQVAQALDATLSPEVEARLGAQETENLEAYGLFKRGELIFKTSGDHQRAADFFRAAIAADSNYAPAYSYLAWMNLYEWVSSNAASDSAQVEETLELVDRALMLDPNLSDAYVSRGTALLERVQVSEALTSYEEAVRLQPGYARAHRAYAWGLALHGRTDEARKEVGRAIELDPQDFFNYEVLASVLLASGDIEGCLRAAQTENSLAEAAGLSLVAFCSAMAGDLEAANAAFVRLDSVALAWYYAKSGEPQRARRIVSNVPNDVTSTARKAMVYAQLGDADTAFSLLDEAYARRLREVGELKVTATLFGDLPNDARWRALLERVGLE